MSDAKEWAIRDEATGDWAGYCLKWGPEPYRFSTYANAAGSRVFVVGDVAFRAGARIVPAPPREMTDGECLVWLAGTGLCVYPPGHLNRGEWDVGSGTGCSATSLFDAIRSARCALEGK